MRRLRRFAERVHGGSAGVVLALSLAACGRGTSRAPAPAPRTHEPARQTVVDAGPSREQPSVEWNAVAPGVWWRRALVVDEWKVLEWVVLRLDLARAVPVARPVSNEVLATLSADDHVLAAVDGGFFDAVHHPDGLLVSEGRVIAPLTAHGGTGILAIDGARADVLDAAADVVFDATARLLVQCGPRLIERDGTLGIARDNGQRFARTAACLRDGGRTLDLVVTWAQNDAIRGPGLQTFARLLAGRSPVGDERGCERALNLDGGPSSGIYVRGAHDATHWPLGPVPWALEIRSPD